MGCVAAQSELFLNNGWNSCFPLAEFVLLGVLSATIASFSLGPLLLLLQIHQFTTNFVVYDEYLSSKIIVLTPANSSSTVCGVSLLLANAISTAASTALCGGRTYAEPPSTLFVGVLSAQAEKTTSICACGLLQQKGCSQKTSAMLQSVRAVLLCARYSADFFCCSIFPAELCQAST